VPGRSKPGPGQSTPGPGPRTLGQRGRWLWRPWWPGLRNRWRRRRCTTRSWLCRRVRPDCTVPGPRRWTGSPRRSCSHRWPGRTRRTCTRTPGSGWPVGRRPPDKRSKQPGRRAPRQQKGKRPRGSIGLGRRIRPRKRSKLLPVMQRYKQYVCIIILISGDGVAERTKASVVTRTVAGSKPGHWRHFSSGSHGVWRERRPCPQIWQIPTGAH